jgi:hypothetical protein
MALIALAIQLRYAALRRVAVGIRHSIPYQIPAISLYRESFTWNVYCLAHYCLSFPCFWTPEGKQKRKETLKDNRPSTLCIAHATALK